MLISRVKLVNKNKIMYSNNDRSSDIIPARTTLYSHAQKYALD